MTFHSPIRRNTNLKQLVRSLVWIVSKHTGHICLRIVVDNQGFETCQRSHDPYVTGTSRFCCTTFLNIGAEGDLLAKPLGIAIVSADGGDLEHIVERVASSFY